MLRHWLRSCPQAVTHVSEDQILDTKLWDEKCGDIRDGLTPRLTAGWSGPRCAVRNAGDRTDR
jgi:hypothetical protein